MERLTLKDARKRLRIDKDDLDGAIIEQSILFAEVSTNLVEAKAEKDKVKNDRDSLEAGISNSFRKTFLRKKEKFTESSLREDVLLDEEYIEVKKKYLKALNFVEAWEVMKESYSQRSFMLRELAHLWTANYYGDTSLSGGDNTKDVIAKSNRRKISRDRKDRSKKRRTTLI